jgi:hypothetical protein
MAAANPIPAERNYQYEQLLSNAIHQHRKVRLRYHYNVHYRVFDPYILFKDEDRRIIIGGIRTTDERKPDKEPAPCKFEVGLITDLEVLSIPYDVSRRFSSYRPKYLNLEVLSAVDR